MKKDRCKVILYYNISLVGLLKLCCLWVECSTHVFEYLGSNPTNRDKLVTIYLSTFGRHFNKSYCSNRPKNNEAAKIITFPVESVLAILEKNCFVDVEGTKAVKRMINLLAITVNLYHEIDADPSGSGSKTDRVRK